MKNVTTKCLHFGGYSVKNGFEYVRVIKMYTPMCSSKFINFIFVSKHLFGELNSEFTGIVDNNKHK